MVKGWVEVRLNLYDPKAKTAGSNEILVPMLVSEHIALRPIIGFNAIEEIMIGKDQSPDTEKVA